MVSSKSRFVNLRNNKRTRSIKNYKVACVECKRTMGVSSPKIKHKQELKLKDGQTIFATYYVCPKCGKCNVVQIDDETSLSLLHQVTNELLSESQGTDAGKIDEVLQLKRNSLINSYRSEVEELIENG